MLARIYADIRWFLEQIAEQFVANGLPTSAAALTYTTLFAVVPLMTVGYVILSVLPAFSGVTSMKPIGGSYWGRPRYGSVGKSPILYPCTSPLSR